MSMLNRSLNRRHLLGSAAASAVILGSSLHGSHVAAQTPTLSDAIDRIVLATNEFLSTLTEEDRTSVSFDWSNDEQKQRWSNLPAALSARDGLMWGNMGEDARAAWLPVMQATLSEEGYNRVIGAWNADEVLREMDDEGLIGSGGGPGGSQGGPNSNASGGSQGGSNNNNSGGGPGGNSGAGGNGASDYSSDYFYIAIIGEPSAASAWQWQFTGHHTTINATIANGNIALTPSFIGVQPAYYTDGNGNAVSPLGDINAAAFALVNALDPDQQAQIVIGSRRIDLVSGPGVTVTELAPEGLAVADMTAEQQQLATDLISKYTGLLTEDLAAARLAEVTDVFADTYFAWYGPTEPESDAYWRIAGPTIIAEYSPQDQLTDDPTQHIHGIYRDPSNEYGVRYQNS